MQVGKPSSPGTNRRRRYRKAMLLSWPMDHRCLPDPPLQTAADFEREFGDDAIWDEENPSEPAGFYGSQGARPGSGPWGRAGTFPDAPFDYRILSLGEPGAMALREQMKAEMRSLGYKHEPGFFDGHLDARKYWDAYMDKLRSIKVQGQIGKKRSARLVDILERGLRTADVWRAIQWLNREFAEDLEETRRALAERSIGQDHLRRLLERWPRIKVDFWVREEELQIPVGRISIDVFPLTTVDEVVQTAAMKAGQFLELAERRQGESDEPRRELPRERIGLLMYLAWHIIRGKRLGNPAPIADAFRRAGAVHTPSMEKAVKRLLRLISKFGAASSEQAQTPATGQTSGVDSSPPDPSL